MSATVSTTKRIVLIPVDDSNACQHSVRWAIDNIIRRDTDFVEVLHVVGEHSPAFGHAFLSFLSDDPVPDTHLDKMGANYGLVTDSHHPHNPVIDKDPALFFLRARFGKQLADAGVRHRIDVVRYGDDAQSVGKIVCANAKNLGAAMVIMSNHNKSALEEMFIGSTSQFVTHNLKVPVVLVHYEDATYAQEAERVSATEADAAARRAQATAHAAAMQAAAASRQAAQAARSAQAHHQALSAAAAERAAQEAMQAARDAEMSIAQNPVAQSPNPVHHTASYTRDTEY